MDRRNEIITKRAVDTSLISTFFLESGFLNKTEISILLKGFKTGNVKEATSNINISEKEKNFKDKEGKCFPLLGCFYNLLLAKKALTDRDFAKASFLTKPVYAALLEVREQQGEYYSICSDCQVKKEKEFVFFNTQEGCVFKENNKVWNTILLEYLIINMKVYFEDSKIVNFFIFREMLFNTIVSIEITEVENSFADTETKTALREIEKIEKECISGWRDAFINKVQEQLKGREKVTLLVSSNEKESAYFISNAKKRIGELCEDFDYFFVNLEELFISEMDTLPDKISYFGGYFDEGYCDKIYSKLKKLKRTKVDNIDNIDNIKEDFLSYLISRDDSCPNVIVVFDDLDNFIDRNIARVHELEKILKLFLFFSNKDQELKDINISLLINIPSVRIYSMATIARMAMADDAYRSLSGIQDILSVKSIVFNDFFDQKKILSITGEIARIVPRNQEIEDIVDERERETSEKIAEYLSLIEVLGFFESLKGRLINGSFSVSRTISFYKLGGFFHDLENEKFWLNFLHGTIYPEIVVALILVFLKTDDSAFCSYLTKEELIKKTEFLLGNERFSVKSNDIRGTLLILRLNDLIGTRTYCKDPTTNSVCEFFFLRRKKETLKLQNIYLKITRNSPKIKSLLKKFSF